MSAGIPVRADTSVPWVDLVAQQADLNAEVMEGLAEVFSKAAIIGGPAVAQFEAAYAEFLGVRHCVGVASRANALKLAPRASGIAGGDEAIFQANTFTAGAEAASRICAVPVPVDDDDAWLAAQVRTLSSFGTLSKHVHDVVGSIRVRTPSGQLKGTAACSAP